MVLAEAAVVSRKEVCSEMHRQHQVRCLHALVSAVRALSAEGQDGPSLQSKRNAQNLCRTIKKKAVIKTPACRWSGDRILEEPAARRSNDEKEDGVPKNASEHSLPRGKLFIPATQTVCHVCVCVSFYQVSFYLVKKKKKAQLYESR